MKTLFALIIIFAALSVQAGVTNVTAKVTVENSTLGQTNSVSITFNQGGSAKDDLTIDSLVWYYAYAKTNGLYTNVFEQWLKDTIKVALQSHNAEKSANDLGAAVAKITTAASTDSSLLTTAQKNQLIAMAATLQ